MSPGFDQIPPNISKPKLKHSVAWVKGDPCNFLAPIGNAPPSPQKPHSSPQNSDLDLKPPPPAPKNGAPKPEVYKMMLTRLSASKNTVDVKVTLDRDTFESSIQEMSGIPGYQNMQLF